MGVLGILEIQKRLHLGIVDGRPGLGDQPVPGAEEHDILPHKARIDTSPFEFLFIGPPAEPGVIGHQEEDDRLIGLFPAATGRRRLARTRRGACLALSSRRSAGRPAGCP